MATGAYHFDLKLTAVMENAPEPFKRSAPEAHDALIAAADAARAALIEHGFTPVRSGYGGYRLEVPK